MRTKVPFLALGCLCLFVGCNRKSQYNDVVKETYIHKYGIPVPKADWEIQGKVGQVIQQKRDGVTVTQNYEEGLLHGKVSYSYPHSSLIETEEYYDHGNLKSQRQNYLNGLAKQEETYSGDSITHVTHWYENGTPSSIEMYDHDFLVSGEYRTPLNVTESKVEEGHGTRYVRTYSGELSAKDTIQNGQMVEKMTFFKNGEPSSIIPYANGVVHGVRLTYQEGGLPSTIEQWSHGVQDGITVMYQNGEKVTEVSYAQGKKHGIERRFRDGSTLAEEISWNHDVQHGPRKLYIDGICKTEWYHEGELVSRTTFERMNNPRDVVTK